MAFHAQGQGLQPLEQKKRAHRSQRSAHIPQQNRPDSGDKGGGPHVLGKADSVVAGVGFGESGKFTGRHPVEAPAVHDNAAQGGSVSSDELGGRVHHNIRAVLNGTDQVRRSKGIVDHQGNAAAMGNISDGADIGYVGIGIAQSLDKHPLGVLPDGLFHRL